MLTEKMRIVLTSVGTILVSVAAIDLLGSFVISQRIDTGDPMYKTVLDKSIKQNVETSELMDRLSIKAGVIFGNSKVLDNAAAILPEIRQKACENAFVKTLGLAFLPNAIDSRMDINDVDKRFLKRFSYIAISESCP